MIFDWSQEKNLQLIRERGVSFEAVVASLEEGHLLAVIPGQGKYRHQKQLLVRVGQYVYVVPCIEDGKRVFLKTVIPSRKMTKKFLRGGEGYEA